VAYVAMKPPKNLEEQAQDPKQPGK
jgi:hypothetical protein